MEKLGSTFYMDGLDSIVLCVLSFGHILVWGGEELR